MGRHRQFSESEVLGVAEALFWERGYEATSTRRLVESTGLTASSLYSAFGSKRELFLRALEVHLDRTQRQRIARLESTLTPGRAISTYFGEMVEHLLEDPQHRGCMLANTALEAASDDRSLRALVAEETITIERFFQRCVAAAQAIGEIPAGRPADELARHLLAVLMGLVVLGWIRPDLELLTSLVRPALLALALPWPPLAQPDPKSQA